jgi:hypothetical protein
LAQIVERASLSVLAQGVQATGLTEPSQAVLKISAASVDRVAQGTVPFVVTTNVVPASKSALTPTSQETRQA